MLGIEGECQSVILKANFDSCAGRLREKSSKIFETSLGNSKFAEGLQEKKILRKPILERKAKMNFL